MNLNLNQTELILYYEKIGSTWLTDSIYTFLAAPFGFMGFILNLFSLFIFYSINIKQTNLYIYLRFYSINGSLLCLVCGFGFFCMAPKYSSHYLAYFWRFYRAYIYSMFYTTLYLIAVLIDIVIAFDRLAIFYKQIQKIIKLNPIIMIFIIILLSIIINLPICFCYYAKSDEEILYDIKYNLSTFILNGRTSFFYSQLGNIVTYIQLFIRDILTLVIEIVISSFAFKLIRKVNLNQLNTNFASSITIDSIRLKRKKLFKHRQLLLMNLILNLSSTISHLVMCVSYALISRGMSMVVFVWISMAFFGVSFKHFTNFFIFYFFDKNFKKKCNEYVKKIINIII